MERSCAYCHIIMLLLLMGLCMTPTIAQGKEADAFMVTSQKKGDDVMEYKYGMRLRGFAPFCQPMKGLIEAKDDPTGMYWSILIYSRPLTEKEMQEYELDKIEEGR